MHCFLPFTKRHTRSVMWRIRKWQRQTKTTLFDTNTDTDNARAMTTPHKQNTVYCSLTTSTTVLLIFTGRYCYSKLWECAWNRPRCDTLIGLAKVGLGLLAFSYAPVVRSRFVGFMLFGFYPRNAMLARVFATATCLSVRLSVTRRYCD